jgi:hemoglobin
VTGIIDDVVAGCLKNQKANFTRGGKYLQTPEKVRALKHSLVFLVSALAEGPYQWEGPTMKKAHEGMRITEAEFDAVRTEVHLVLSKKAIAADDVKLILAAVDSTRPDIVIPAEVAGSPPPPPTDSFFQRVGGEEKVRKMISDLVDRLVKDDRVNLSRGGKYPMTEDRVQHLKRQFFDLALAIEKGREAYKGKSMLEAHKGMGITDGEYDAFLDDLHQVLRAHNVGLLDVLLIQKLLESKREDIVEKPGRPAGPRGEAPPKAVPPGQPGAPAGASSAPAGDRPQEGRSDWVVLWGLALWALAPAAVLWVLPPVWFIAKAFR